MSTDQTDEELKDQQPAGDEPAGEPAAADEAAADAGTDTAAEGAEPTAEEEVDYLELAKRTRADFDNYRKRTQRDIAAAKVRGSVELAREIATALDNIERALEHESDAAGTDETAQRLIQALRTAQADVLTALERNGITPIAAAGEEFDPNLHEAIARRPAEEGEQPGTCVVVYQTGYAAGDEVVRAARVVVAD